MAEAQARATAHRPIFGRGTHLDLRRARHWLELAGLSAAYIVAAKFGIELTVAHGVVTPVWAPSGISLAALLIFGRRLWPAVLIGAFVANATSGAEPLVAASIAAGNTLEAVLGAFLLMKVGFRLDLERVRDVLALVVLGAGLSTLISATNGVTVLVLADAAEASYGTEWVLWWFGDAVGDLMVAPLLLLAFVHRRKRPSGARLLEGLALLCSLIALSSVVFLAGAWRYPYVVFPLLLWAALRFHQLGAATSSFIVAAIGTWGTMAGTVPIAETNATARVQIIQALVGVVAISMLVVGATLAERETANQAAEQTAARLSEAQALTHIGSWEWDLATDSVTWSDELYRIFGFAPRSVAVTHASFLGRVDPDDRRQIEDTVGGAYADRQPFRFEYRIARVDGSTRLLQAHGRVILDESGQPARMVGTAQDITELKHAEDLRDDILSTVSHELRTPLASILAFSLTLQERSKHLGEQAFGGVVEQIVGQVRRLDRLLSDLMDADRLRHGLVAPVRGPTDVTQLIGQIAAAHDAAEHVITVNAEPTAAQVDAAQLERIVDNLVSNAVKHTPPGTPIALRLERQQEDLLIIVDDEGPGIPDEFKTAVFDIFDRGAKTRSGGPGTGIGLSLVARFAALHGGRAWVEDSRSGGASFRVLLPNCVLAQP